MTEKENSIRREPRPFKFMAERTAKKIILQKSKRPGSSNVSIKKITKAYDGVFNADGWLISATLTTKPLGQIEVSHSIIERLAAVSTTTEDFNIFVYKNGYHFRIENLK